MNYLDVYWSRINHLGETTAERIRNGGIKSFEKWKAESPHTIQNLSVERGIYFDGIILTNKDKEYEKIMFLNVSNDISIVVGDILNWTLDNGTIEKWIIIQEEKKVNGTYKTFWIIRCNYLMKWIDSLGHLQQSWAYFVSSLDSKIKGNFRTWNNLITPQPNKYAEILMPRYPIDRATNFIIEDESWTVVEYDHTSVPGVIYLSLTEGKINKIYDDIDNDIADLDKLAKYDILISEINQTFNINDEIELNFTLIKNGTPIEEEYTLIPVDKSIVRNIEGKLKAISIGETDIIVKLTNFPFVQKTIHVVINDEPHQFIAYIEGDSKIRLDRRCEYILKSNEAIIDDVEFSLNDYSLAVFELQEHNKCVVHANSKNKLGNVILTARYNNIDYTKKISIVPLW